MAEVTAMAASRMELEDKSVNRDSDHRR